MAMSAKHPKRSKRLVGGMVLVTLLAGAGCGEDSTAAPTTTAASASSGAAARLVAPAEFERRVADAGVVTINVHVPDEGSIAGTDLTIPFDEIATTEQLPAELDTPLAVYCRSGNMSATAVRDLAALGYTDIVELDGGFNAWKASGRELDGGGS